MVQCVVLTKIELKANASQHPIRALLFFTVVVFIGGALMAPWLFWTVQHLAPDSHLAHNPFHRFVNRSLLTLAVLSIWPLLRSLGATSWRDVGIVKPGKTQWKLFLEGLALSFGSLAFVAVIILVAHGSQLNPELNLEKLTGDIAAAAGTAIGVAIIEEILFRGAIFGALRKAWDWKAALVLSSMVYAIVHFMQSADLPDPITWTSGLRILPLMLRGFENVEVLIPAFLNLTFIGVLLGLAYQRTGTLYFSIGLHAGWIFWLRAYGNLTRPMPDHIVHRFLGTQKLVDGWMTLCVLVVTLIILISLPLGKTKENPL